MRRVATCYRNETIQIQCHSRVWRSFPQNQKEADHPEGQPARLQLFDGEKTPLSTIYKGLI